MYMSFKYWEANEFIPVIDYVYVHTIYMAIYT